MNLEIAQKRFKKHKLTTIVDTEEVKMYLFKNPDSIIYYQRWILHNGYLIVTGDCYSAIYVWDCKHDLEWFGDLDLCYFSSKCIADRHGSEQQIFDANKVSEIMMNYIYQRNLDEYLPEEDDNDNISLKDKVRIIVKGIKSETDEYFDDYDLDQFMNFEFSNPYEGMQFMTSHPDIFGSHIFEIDLMVKSVTPYFHLAALKEAAKQIKKN